MLFEWYAPSDHLGHQKMRAQSLYERRRKSHILFSMKNKSNKPTPYSIELAIGPAIEHLPIIIRKHSTSRRMVIRYQPLQHHVSLTLPRYVSIRQGLHFIEEKRAWLVKQITENAKTIPLEHGQTIPILGNDYTLLYVGGRGVVTLDEKNILIPGDETFLKRRLLEWLKRQLRAEITHLAEAKAKQIKKPLGKISLRDTSSRWGSCSHDGNLSFSWRLVFAPYAVLDYVVAHEVAHIKHHDHSPAFWAAVELLCPEYDKYRNWLKTHGAVLYSYN